MLSLSCHQCHQWSSKVRELEKVRKKHEKIKLDIIYLEDCLANKPIPKFLFFKLSNNRLRNSKVYCDIQVRLLREEINHHKKDLFNENSKVEKVRGGARGGDLVPWHHPVFLVK